MMSRPKIYLFGDSITEESFGEGGWGASLAHHFARTMDVVLRGYSGYNTRWAAKLLDWVFGAEESSPAAATVFFGANDACLPDQYAGYQHVPLIEYSENLISIVSFLKKRWPKMAIILITPPPIDEDGRLRNPYMENPTNEVERTNEAAGLYAKACVDVARQCGVHVIDLWTFMQQFPLWQSSFLRDGLHLTKSGNQIVFEEVLKKLKEECLCVESLPIDLPLISEIDPNNPLKSFHHY